MRQQIYGSPAFQRALFEALPKTLAIDMLVELAGLTSTASGHRKPTEAVLVATIQGWMNKTREARGEPKRSIARIMKRERSTTRRINRAVAKVRKRTSPRLLVFKGAR